MDTDYYTSFHLRFVIVTLSIFFSETFISLSQSTSDTGFINTLNRRTFGLINSDPDSAKDLALQALDLSIKSDYLFGQSEAYSRLGIIEKNKGHYEQSIKYHRLSLTIRLDIGNKAPIANTYSNLAVVYHKLGRNDTSLRYYLDALRIREQVKDSIGILKSFTNLGNFYFDLNEASKSLTYYNMSYELAVKLKDTTSIISSINNIGTIWHSKSDDKSALEFYNKAESKALETGDIKQLTEILNNKAISYAALNNYQKAISTYRKLVPIVSSLELNQNLSTIYSNMGSNFMQMKKYDSAVYYLEQSNSIAEPMGLIDLQATNRKNLSLVYYEKGDFKKAYFNSLSFSQLNDSIFNVTQSQQLLEIQGKYETEKKDQQIKLQGEKLKSNQLQRNVSVLTALAMLILLAGVVTFFFQRQSISTKKQKIAQQKIDQLLKDQELSTYNAMIEGQEEERKRIAEDLHDRLGSMLATVKMHFNAVESKVDIYQSHNVHQYEKANTLLDEACDEVRKIAHNLNTGMVMSFGLVSALNEMCDRVDSSGQVKCKVLAYGMEKRLDTQTEITIYRIIQESVSNILKHAQAKNITIQLNRQDDTLAVTVEDDGAGFDVPEKMKSNGMGLKNIMARAEKLNAKISIDSTPGKGTITILEVPLNKVA